LAQSPTGFPCLRLPITFDREIERPLVTEDSLTMNVAQASQGIAQRPAFAQCNFQCCDLIGRLLEAFYRVIKKG